MSSDSKYKEFYDNAPTYSDAIAALNDNECPEQIVADILSFKVLPTDDGTIGDRLSPYYSLLPAGIDNRILSSDSLDQIFEAHVEGILEASVEFADGPGFFTQLHELFETVFGGLLEQVNLSSKTIGKFSSAMETLSKAMIDARSSEIGVEDGFDYYFYFGHFAEIFRAVASHPNSTQEQKDNFLEFSTLMKEKEAEVAED
jgi:hypothetical protein